MLDLGKFKWIGKDLLVVLLVYFKYLFDDVFYVFD